MGLFRRKTSQPAAPTPAATAQGVPADGAVSGGTAPVGNNLPHDAVAPGSVGATPVAAANPAHPGPYDVSEVPDLGARADLGALRIPVINGMQLRMELDRATQQITGATIMLPQAGGVSSLQLQAFAAPKSSGIWDEIRAEIAGSIGNTPGGSADDVPGEFGRELIANISRSGPDGSLNVRRARFVGHDGPRWFVRGVISGPAANDPEAAKVLEDVFRNLVVVRDNTAKPPRDLLPLTLPGQAEKLAGAPANAVPNIDPTKRGPEIAEVR